MRRLVEDVFISRLVVRVMTISPRVKACRCGMGISPDSVRAKPAYISCTGVSDPKPPPFPLALVLPLLLALLGISVSGKGEFGGEENPNPAEEERECVEDDGLLAGDVRPLRGEGEPEPEPDEYT